jgi:hypothetical protein
MLHVYRFFPLTTSGVAKYLKNRGFDNEYYMKLILDFIRINGSANRQDIEDLLSENYRITNTFSRQQDLIKLCKPVTWAPQS